MAKRLLAELTPGKAKKAAHGVTALVGCRYMVGRRHDDRAGLKDALRLLPDVVRLLRRLSTDPNLPKGVRVRLVLLLAAGSGQAAGRLVRTEVDYSRLYMAGHVPSDLVDGTLLGDTLAEYYLVRFPGSPGSRNRTLITCRRHRPSPHAASRDDHNAGPSPGSCGSSRTAV